MTKKPDDSLLPVTAGDINKLKSMVDDLYNNVGKILVHAEVNDDDIESTVSNILSDIRCCLVDRWAEKFLPGEGTPMEPSKSGFPDDDDWEEEYEKFGFSRCGTLPRKGEVPRFFNGATYVESTNGRLELGLSVGRF